MQKHASYSSSFKRQNQALMVGFSCWIRSSNQHQNSMVWISILIHGLQHMYYNVLHNSMIIFGLHKKHTSIFSNEKHNWSQHKIHYWHSIFGLTLLEMKYHNLIFHSLFGWSQNFCYSWRLSWWPSPSELSPPHFSFISLYAQALARTQWTQSLL